jgi:hypothetical protein
MLDRCPDCHRIISGPYCACVIDHGENPDEWDDEPTRERDNWEDRHREMWANAKPCTICQTPMLYPDEHARGLCPECQYSRKGAQ